MKTDVRKCRVCGCTDDDCTVCVQRTGKPCHWVSEDLCSACANGFNTLIRVKRGNTNVASVRVGGRTYRASSTSLELVACERAAEKALKAVHARGFRVERYQTLSIKAGRAALFLEFEKGGAAPDWAYPTIADWEECAGRKASPAFCAGFRCARDEEQSGDWAMQAGNDEWGVGYDMGRTKNAMLRALAANAPADLPAVAGKVRRDVGLPERESL